MALLEHPWRCDGCQILKEGSNNWLLGIVVHTAADAGFDAGIIFRTTQRDGSVGMTGYVIIPWNEAIARCEHGVVHHLCGESCAIRKQSEFLCQ